MHVKPRSVLRPSGVFNYTNDCARSANREIEMMVQAAARIEARPARGAPIVARQVRADAQLRATLATQHCRFVEHLPWPRRERMIREFVMAFLARVEFVAAPEPDGDYVPLAVVVRAAGSVVQLHTANLRPHSW